MTRDELRERIAEVIYANDHGLSSTEMTIESILVLLPEMPKLEWRGTDLYLGSLSLGFVDDTGTAWNAYAGCDPDPIGYGLGNAEARAAVETAVRKALGNDA